MVPAWSSSYSCCVLPMQKCHPSRSFIHLTNPSSSRQLKGDIQLADASYRIVMDFVLLVVDVLLTHRLVEIFVVESKKLVDLQTVLIAITLGVVGIVLLAQAIHHRRTSCRLPHEKICFVRKLNDCLMCHLSGEGRVVCQSLADNI
jgi:hypothetical protein